MRPKIHPERQPEGKCISTVSNCLAPFSNNKDRLIRADTLERNLTIVIFVAKLLPSLEM